MNTCNQAASFASMSASQLSDALKNDQTIQLIDVREVHERDICHIGGEHIPLSLLAREMDRFSKDTLTVVYCKSGGRSAQACQTLVNAGFTRVANLEKGILGWIDAVDNSLKKY
jgi:rhodanese-related sulfurtransferase